MRHFISEAANQNQRRSILQPGDILFSIAGMIGETAVVTESDVPLNTNQALAIIRLRPSLANPEFSIISFSPPLYSYKSAKKSAAGE
jgi:type I restriction enzyme, S subunit